MKLRKLIWHFNTRFVLKTTKTQVFVMITEIFWQTFWRNKWRFIIDAVKDSSFCYILWPSQKNSTWKVFLYVHNIAFSFCETFVTLCSKRSFWIEHDFQEECHFLYLLIFHACFYFDTFWCCELFHFSGIYSWKSGSAFNNRTCYGESIHICEGMYSNILYKLDD